ncbi:MAG: universal stress protein, partial [Acidiferrobacterales bacterium]
MFKKILVPVDLTEPAFADKAVAAAVEEARHHKADLHVMTVLPGFGMPIVASFFPADAMQKAAQEVKKELQDYVAKKVPKDISVTLAIA